MAPRPPAESTHRGSVGRGLVLLSLLVGLSDAIYLLVNHLRFKTGRDIGGFCDISAHLNCRAAIESDYSTLFGIPVPVWSVAFYAALLVLVLRLGSSRNRRGPGWSVVLLGFVAAFAYSMFLLSVLLFQLSAVCPGCLVLDTANTLGLVGAVLAPGRPLKDTLKAFPSELQAALLGRDGFAVLVSFGLSFLVTAVISLNQLRVSEEPVPPDEAYDIVEGYPTRTPLGDIEHAPSKGAPDAPIVIVEFSDFECPFCRRFSETLHEIHDQHPDEVRIRFMNYPLNQDCNPNIQGQFHATACLAARAGVCADEQRKFWEMHDLMFENNTHLERDDLLELARSLHLDPDEFEACLDSDYSLDRVESDAAVGHAAAAAAGQDSIGTPFSFVDGLLVRGARTIGQMEALIEAEREAQARAGSGAGSGSDQ